MASTKKATRARPRRKAPVEPLVFDWPRDRAAKVAEEADTLHELLDLRASGEQQPVPYSLAWDADLLASFFTFIARNGGREVPAALVHTAEEWLEAWRGLPPLRWHSALVEVISKRRRTGSDPFRSDASVNDVCDLLWDLQRLEGSLPPSLAGNWDETMLERAAKTLRSLRIANGKAGGRGRSDLVAVETAAARLMEIFSMRLRTRLSDLKRPRKTTRRNSARE